jgi:uncharacterized protein (TIGR00297 family)
LTSAEWKRKAVHAGIGLFALTLRWLDWRLAAAAALLGLLFNAIVMPRIGRGLYRDPAVRHDAGIVAYPAMVLLLILVFSGKYIPIAAAVWAMMAFGDPAASIAGKLLGGPRLPWNPSKSWAGLLANALVGGISSILVFLFVSEKSLHLDAVAILGTGAVIYAFLESVRAGLDDNIVAALPTALAVYQMNAAYPAPLLRIAEIPGRTLLVALAVNLAAAAVMGGLRVVSRSGAIAGAVAGFVILAFGGAGAYGLLWAFFLAGTVATKLGYRRKASVGVAQKDSGRRGAAHVAANCLVPASLLLLGVRSVGYVGAFGAALADTLGTEIGTLFGKKPFSPLTLKPLPPGTPGAISLPGTAASLAGAAAIAAAGIGLGLIPPRLAVAAAVGGFLGALAESLLSAMGRRFLFRLDHEFANGLNTFVGAMVALRLAGA